MEHRIKVHVFGATSSPSCSNYALKQTVNYINRSDYSVESLNAIDLNFYVDDLVISLKSDSDAENIVKEVSDVIAQSRFNLTSYASDSRVSLQHLPVGKLSKSNNSNTNLLTDNHRVTKERWV